MKQNIVVIGGGTQCPILIDIIEKENKYSIIGIIDSRAGKGSKLYGYTCLGDIRDMSLIEKAFIGGIISVGDNYSRELIFNKVEETLRGSDFEWVNAIHPSCQIAKGVEF